MTKEKVTAKPQSLPGGDKGTYVSRPRRKPDTSTKGKLNEWDNGYKEFIPAGTKESNRQMMRQLGNSSFYKSEGAKESSFSCHLNVDGKLADPVAEMDELYLELTKDQRKQAPKMPEVVGQGRMLYDDGQHLQVWLDREKGEVSILTRLECGQNIERMLLQAQATMNVTLGRYRQEIINNNNNK